MMQQHYLPIQSTTVCKHSDMLDMPEDSNTQFKSIHRFILNRSIYLKKNWPFDSLLVLQQLTVSE